MPFAIIGDAQTIRELLCGPIQHNEHMKGWRWHMYVQDDHKRFASVMAEVKRMAAERRQAEPIEHETSERRTPVAILLRCSCGWSRQISRRQNALARAAKVRAAWREHDRDAERRDHARDERKHERA